MDRANAPEVISHASSPYLYYTIGRELCQEVLRKKLKARAAAGIFTSSAPPFAVAPRIRLKVSGGAPSKMKFFAQSLGGSVGNSISAACQPQREGIAH